LTVSVVSLTVIVQTSNSCQFQ